MQCMLCAVCCKHVSTIYIHGANDIAFVCMCALRRRKPQCKLQCVKTRGSCHHSRKPYIFTPVFISVGNALLRQSFGKYCQQIVNCQYTRNNTYIVFNVLSLGCLRISFSLYQQPHQIRLAVVMTLRVSQLLLAASWALVQYMVPSVTKW